MRKPVSPVIQMSSNYYHILRRKNLQEDNHVTMFTAGSTLISLFSSLLSISFYKNFWKVISDNFIKAKATAMEYL